MNSISFNNFKYILFKKFLILIDVRYYNRIFFLYKLYIFIMSYKILGPIRHGLQVTRSHISPSHLNIIL